MKPTRCTSLTVLIALLALVIAGCGGGVPLAEVTGTVTVDGRTVPGLEVSFEPQGTEGGSSLGYTDATGKYELFYSDGQKGAVVGTHRVQVVAGETGDEGEGIMTIPARYNTQSELTFEVKSGANTFDIAITRQ